LHEGEQSFFLLLEPVLNIVRISDINRTKISIEDDDSELLISYFIYRQHDFPMCLHIF